MLRLRSLTAQMLARLTALKVLVSCSMTTRAIQSILDRAKQKSRPKAGSLLTHKNNPHQHLAGRRGELASGGDLGKMRETGLISCHEDIRPKILAHIDRKSVV